jgi:hypothetical protein
MLDQAGSPFAFSPWYFILLFLFQFARARNDHALNWDLSDLEGRITRVGLLGPARKDDEKSTFLQHDYTTGENPRFLQSCSERLGARLAGWTEWMKGDKRRARTAREFGALSQTGRKTRVGERPA